MDTPKYRTEFPDFPETDLPALPVGFEDTSWHNDACPSFTSDGRGLTIFINYTDPAKREVGWPRFSLQNQEAGVETTGGFDTDSWDEALAYIRQRTVDRLADRFAKALREWLTPRQFAEMVRLNSSDPAFAGGCCASHNYCDANMAMMEAWQAVLGVDSVNADDEAQAALWNDAWNKARERHIGAPGKVPA